MNLAIITGHSERALVGWAIVLLAPHHACSPKGQHPSEMTQQEVEELVCGHEEGLVPRPVYCCWAGPALGSSEHGKDRQPGEPGAGWRI